MWKKTSVLLALGLMWIPGSATAAGLLFDPFAGIVSGIAQGMAADGVLESDSNYDGPGTVTGGNVVIGNTLPDAQQSAEAGGIYFDNAAGEGVTQGVNVIKKDEVDLLIMQGASITGNVKMVTNSTKGGSVQGINVITACGGVGCE